VSRIRARRLLSILFAAALGVACSGPAGAQDPTMGRVQEKARRVEKAAPKWVEAGGNPERLRPLSERVDRAMKAGRPAEAEQALDEILVLVEATPSARDREAAAGGNAAAQRVQEKARLFEERGPLWVQSGGDPREIDKLAKRLDPLLKAGNFAEAEGVLDRLLALVGTSAAASAPAVPRARGAQSVRLGEIPPDAAIVFHRKDRIYVVDADGRNETQITFAGGRHLEHVAVDYGRTKVVANYFADPRRGGASSRLVLFDLAAGTETELLPDFEMAGNGGVEWDPDGNLYFAGVQRVPVANPRGRAEFIRNAGANDVWSVRWDGTNLRRLTDTPEHGEADVSVSADGRLVTYMATHIDPPNDSTQIWMSRSDGSGRRLVYQGGKMKESSVHDPEFSPDGTRIVFSKVNPEFHNFRRDPNANTAHDLWVVSASGGEPRRITQPGPISVIPDWVGSKIVFLELTDRSGVYNGLSIVNQDGSGYRRLLGDANIAKWIPPAR
jgi:Tol biopolymer transport system component